jgi:hypothetical protein
MILLSVLSVCSFRGFVRSCWRSNLTLRVNSCLKIGPVLTSGGYYLMVLVEQPKLL